MKKRLPPHLMYYIHAGNLMSTDIDLEAYIEFSERLFYCDEPTLLKDLTPEKLEDLIFDIQASIVDSDDLQYRDNMSYVKTSEAKNRKLKEHIECQVNEVPKERTMRRLLLDEKFQTYSKEADGRELTLFVLAEFDNLLETWMNIIKGNSAKYSKFKNFTKEYMDNNKRAIFKDADGKRLNNSEFDSENEQHLLLLIKHNRVVRERFVSYFQKDYVNKYGKKHTNKLTDDQKIRFDTKISKSVESAWSRIDADDRKELLSVLTMAGFFIPAFPHEIPEKMKAYCKELIARLNSSADPIDTACWVFKEYCNIHPYANGAGRVARYVMNLVLDQNNLPTLNFDDDEEYMMYVIAANDDYKLLIPFIEKKLEEMQELIADKAAYQKKYPSISPPLMKEITEVCKKSQANVNTWHSECQFFDPHDRDGSFTALKARLKMRAGDRAAGMQMLMDTINRAEESGSAFTKGNITFINL